MISEEKEGASSRGGRGAAGNGAGEGATGRGATSRGVTGRGATGRSADAGEDAGENAGEDEATKMLRQKVRSMLIENVDVKWDDLIGVDKAKNILQQAIVLPHLQPQLFGVGKLTPTKSVLLFGLSSYLAKAVATEAKSLFFCVSASDIDSKWKGESQKLVAMLYEEARKEKSVIFIDEVDSMGGSRDNDSASSASSILKEMLSQADGVGKDNENVFLLCATNKPWSLDDALICRFQCRIQIGLPDKNARKLLFQKLIPNVLTDEEYNILADNSEGASGRTLVTRVIDKGKQYGLTEASKSSAQYIEEEGGFFTCCTMSPNCVNCPQLEGNRKCGSCNAVYMKMIDVPVGKLRVREVRMADFETLLKNTQMNDAGDIDKLNDWCLNHEEKGN